MIEVRNNTSYSPNRESIRSYIQNSPSVLEYFLKYFPITERLSLFLFLIPILGNSSSFPYGAGSTTVSPINVTAVCASALPFSVAPLFSTIAVLSNMFPLKTDVVPRVVWPATCQKMFLACAPPLRITWTPLPTVRVCAIWNIQTSFAPPERESH